MIKLQVIGYLGKNAEMRQVNGKSVLNFTIAHNERYKNSAGITQEQTIWTDCSLWHSQALAPYLLQGTQVFVEGNPTLECYTNSKGEPAISLKLRVTQVKLLSPILKQPGETETDTLNALLDESTEHLPY
jgi:single-strand DNA-binding protein